MCQRSDMLTSCVAIYCLDSFGPLSWEFVETVGDTHGCRVCFCRCFITHDSWLCHILELYILSRKPLRLREHAHSRTFHIDRAGFFSFCLNSGILRMHTANQRGIKQCIFSQPNSANSTPPFFLFSPHRWLCTARLRDGGKSQ